VARRPPRVAANLFFVGARGVAIHYRNQAGRLAVEVFEIGTNGLVTRAAAHYA
jgi:hypothetical protein